VPRSTLPVYGRQLFPELLLGETLAQPEKSGETLFENDGVRLWTLPAVDAGIGIISFKSKMHAIGDEVLDGVLVALKQTAGSLDGLVIWHDAPFAVGANLKQISDACVAGDFERLVQTVAKFQKRQWRSSTRKSPWWLPCRAWRWVAVASSPCTLPSACWRWKAISVWSKSASG
jgi:3-hydroxyacyl-CoA dehydrogenase